MRWMVDTWEAACLRSDCETDVYQMVQCTREIQRLLAIRTNAEFVDMIYSFDNVTCLPNPTATST